MESGWCLKKSSVSFGGKHEAVQRFERIASGFAAPCRQKSRAATSSSPVASRATTDPPRRLWPRQDRCRARPSRWLLSSQSPAPTETEAQLQNRPSVHQRSFAPSSFRRCCLSRTRSGPGLRWCPKAPRRKPAASGQRRRANPGPRRPTTRLLRASNFPTLRAKSDPGRPRAEAVGTRAQGFAVQQNTVRIFKGMNRKDKL